MTSFMINAHVGRELSATWSKDPDCTFCKIIAGEIPASKVYEDEEVIAILDILPLRRGHTLVIPKGHISHLSDLSPEQAAAVGKTVSKVARALTLALGNNGLNVVCNQEYAQAVPHVHYHVIPAPILGGENSVEATTKAVGGKAPLTHKEMHQLEFDSREELDDDDAIVLLEKIQSRLCQEINILSLAFAPILGDEFALFILSMDARENLRLAVRDMDMESQELSLHYSDIFQPTVISNKIIPFPTDYPLHIVPLDSQDETDQSFLGGALILGGRQIPVYEVASDEGQEKLRGKRKRLEVKKHGKDAVEAVKANSHLDQFNVYVGHQRHVIFLKRWRPVGVV